VRRAIRVVPLLPAAPAAKPALAGARRSVPRARPRAGECLCDRARTGV